MVRQKGCLHDSNRESKSEIFVSCYVPPKIQNIFTTDRYRSYRWGYSLAFSRQHSIIFNLQCIGKPGSWIWNDRKKHWYQFPNWIIWSNHCKLGSLIFIRCYYCFQESGQERLVGYFRLLHLMGTLWQHLINSKRNLCQRSHQPDFGSYDLDSTFHG